MKTQVSFKEQYTDGQYSKGVVASFECDSADLPVVGDVVVFATPEYKSYKVVARVMEYVGEGNKLVLDCRVKVQEILVADLWWMPGH